MNCYEVLNIEPTGDIKTIKKAYARRSREYHPEEHPEEFRILHDAYEEAIFRAKWNNVVFKGEVKLSLGDTVPLFMSEEETKDQEAPETEEVPEPVKTPEPRDVQMWDDRFEQIASAGNTNQGMTERVRDVIGRMHELYMNEAERGKLYRWKDFFDDPQLAEVCGSRAFFVEWYRFLETHSLFPLQIWQYFASLDGSRFSGEPYGIQRFPYQFYIERMQSLRQRRAELENDRSDRKSEEKDSEVKYTGFAPDPEEKVKIPLAVKIVLFLAVLAGSALSSLLLGILAGEILG